jgi:hypothetical protein
MASTNMEPSSRQRLLARGLRPFAKVDQGEGARATLLALTLFILLTAFLVRIGMPA